MPTICSLPGYLRSTCLLFVCLMFVCLISLLSNVIYLLYILSFLCNSAVYLHCTDRCLSAFKCLLYACLLSSVCQCQVSILSVCWLSAIFCMSVCFISDILTINACLLYVYLLYSVCLHAIGCLSATNLTINVHYFDKFVFFDAALYK